MTNNKKKVIVASFLAASAFVLSASSGVVQAQGDTHKPHHPIEQRMHRMQHLDNRLDRAVKEGKITKDQKDKILARFKEDKAKLDEIRKIDNIEKRREAMRKLRDEVKQWLQDNGIDPALVLPKPFKHLKQS